MRKTGALLACLGVYAAALAAAVLAGGLVRQGHPLFVAFIADIVATVVVFLFSMAFNNSSIYDPYWSLAPPVIALYWLTAGGIPDRFAPRPLLALALVVVWSVRLTFNWARQWRGMEHEDWRYRRFRERHGSLYWPVSFFGIHLFPTLMVFLGCLSLYPVMTSGAGSGRPFGPLDVLAAAATLGAIVIEATADRQLHEFAKGSPKPGQIMSGGLWARCRHPNYLGEVLFWWGLYLFCLAASPSHWWFVLGPAAITVLFLRISVPMMDQHLLASKNGYRDHMEQVPALLPRLFQKKN
jgi:steroid 5-alpha reductase family enzyme